MTFAPRASAGVVRGSSRPSASRQTPTARLAAFNGVVSDRVSCIHGNVMFQAPALKGLRAAARPALRASRNATRQVTRAEDKLNVADLGKSDLEGKRVLVRADLNVPLDKDQNITDDTRIRAAIPTLKYLVENGAKILLTSHLGRPKNGPEDKFRLTPVVPRLSELLGTKVEKVDDCIGPEVEAAVGKLQNGQVLVLENVRFYKEETANDVEFAKKLAANADVFVNDAFGTAHRAHASTEGVTRYLRPSAAGLLLKKELDYLDGAISNPKRPFVAIVGGSKVSSKIDVIKTLLEKADKVIIVGGMVFTFDKARGYGVGSSLVEDDKVDLAKELLQSAGDKIILPTDVIIADKFAEDAKTDTVQTGDVPDGWMGLDIGPDSVKLIQDTLADAQTVLWNGPAGVFEMEAFSKGTFAIAQTLADITKKGAITIVGGGDSVAAVEQANLGDQISHISTGGGASLELIEGKTLPGVAALDNQKVHA
jgi:phosphoglycerate kinase